MKKYFLLQAALLLIGCSYAQVRLPRLIRDSMILQRDAKVNIWGWASPNEKITLTLNKKSYKTKADAAGNWALMLPPV